MIGLIHRFTVFLDHSRYLSSTGLDTRCMYPKMADHHINYYLIKLNEVIIIQYKYIAFLFFI